MAAMEADLTARVVHLETELRRYKRYLATGAVLVFAAFAVFGIVLILGANTVPQKLSAREFTVVGTTGGGVHQIIVE